MFLHTEPEQMEKVENCEQHQKGFLNRGRSLLVVVSSPPNEGRYSNFTRLVAEYNKKEPFNFKMPSILQKDGFHKVRYITSSSYVLLSKDFTCNWKYAFLLPVKLLQTLF